MSTECNKALAEAERQRDYYKEMYEMRTKAYIKLSHEYEIANTNIYFRLNKIVPESTLELSKNVIENSLR